MILLLLLAAPPAPVELRIDASVPIGKVKALHGVNGGPLNTGGTLVLTARFRELAPPLARLHDCHWPNPDVVDMAAVFPDPAADPAKPGSYDFARTDEYLKALAGTGIVYRLGESIEHQKVKRRVRPPKDPDRWAAACVGIVRHYNDGWADGHRMGIRYWEIWNEPDNRPAMWTGTDEQYLRLYSAAAKAIKDSFPGLRVGGPGLGNSGTLKGAKLEPTPFFKKFLAHCRNDKAPLDFFSWHCYSDDPTELVRRAVEVRRLLDAAGFRKAESHLNEWNYLPGGEWGGMMSKDALARRRWHARLGGPEGATFSASALMLLQDAPLDAANYFSAEPQGMGLFDCHGVPKKTFHALKAFAALAGKPRLAVKGKLAGGAALAALDGKGVTVLLSRHAATGGKVSLSLPGLPWKGKTDYEILTVDKVDDLAQTQVGRFSQDEDLIFSLPARTVLLVRLRPA